MQYRDGHISTCLIKTLVIYFCAYCACASYIFIIITHFFIYLYSLFVIVVHLFCSLFDSFCFVVRFHFINSFVLPFVVHCFKEKSSILILNCVQVFRSCIPVQHHLYESINIIQQTPPTLS